MIERAYEELNQFSWTEEELFIYEEEVKRTMDNLASEEYIFNQGKAEGMEKGIEKGKAEGLKKGIEGKAIEIAASMLKKGFAIKVIEEITGLSKEAIEQLNQG